ncbi:MAG: hypothetical protein V4583_01140, partial [Pseudomonadota bacterium]
MARPVTPSPDLTPGLAELAAARAASRRAVVVAFLFSALVNLLLLTAPLYMLQVYDRVLVSRSEETLLALSLLMAFLFLIMAVLDHARGRIMARVGARLQAGLDQRVLSASFRRLAVAPQDVAALVGHMGLRASTMVRLDRTADQAEIRAMRGMLDEAMDAGAIGLSTG